MSFFSAIGGILGAAVGTVVAPGLGTVLGGVLGGSIGGSVDSSNAQSEANEINVALARESNALTQQENEKNRRFNAEQATLAFERQRQLQEEQNEWNSVQSQMQRFRAAGMNPFVAMGNGLSQASGGVSSPAAASAPSSASFHSPQVNPVTPMGVGIVDGVMKFADATASLSKAGLDKAQSEKILKLLPYEIVGQDLANTFQSVYAPLLAKAQYKNILEDTALKTGQIMSLQKQGKLTEAETALSKLKQSLIRMETNLRGEEAKLMHQRNESYLTELQSALATAKSQQAANYGAASLNNAEAKRINELLPGEKLQQQVQYALTSAQASKTWEDIKHSAVERDKMAREMAKITLECEGLTLDNEKARIYVRRYEEILDNAIKMDKLEFNQMIQDYLNPFKYVGSLLAGSGAAVIKAAVK